MTIEERILQFQKMVETDPANELGYFSLGNALFEAKRFAEAGPAFQRVLALNPHYSRAHLMLGKTQIETGHKDLAIQTLTNGYLVAHKRGDLLPRNEMGDLLKSLGAAVPDPDAKARPAGGAAPGEGGFVCSRCGGGAKMAERPFKGPLGEKVWANVCQQCFKEWIAMGTKVINELRLPMHDPQAQEMYDKHMIEFLSLPT